MVRDKIILVIHREVRFQGGSMPIDVTYSNHGAGVILVGRETVTGPDLLQADDVMYESEEKIKKMRFILSDYTRVTATTLEQAELTLSIQKDKAAARINPDIVIAVVTGKEITYGVSRMWQILGEIHEYPWKEFTTRSLSEAKNWITEQTGLEVI